MVQQSRIENTIINSLFFNEEFIDYIGDILLELLEEKLKDGTAIKN